MSQARLRERIDQGLDALAMADREGGQERVDVFLAGLEATVEGAHLTVAEVVQGLLGVIDALDRAVPAEERHVPDMLASERAMLRWIGQFTNSAVGIVTERLEVDARAQRESRARLLALQRVGAAVTSSLELDETLEAIVAEAATLIEGVTARLRLADEDGKHLVLQTSAGVMSDSGVGMSVPVESTLAGLCYRSGRPVISNDVASDPRASLSTHESSQTRSLLSVPLLVRGAPTGVLSITSLSDRPFEDADAELMSLFADHAAVAIENGRLFQQAQSQITQMEILNRVSSVLSSTLDLNTVYRAIHQEITRMMVADAFLIILRGESGGWDLAYIVDVGQVYAARHDVSMPSQYLRAMENREAITFEAPDLPTDGALERYGDMLRQVQSIAAAPLMRGADAIGVISAQSYLPNSYRQRDCDLLSTVANVAAIAIENARLYDQAHGLAVAEERNRLAREIHDTIAQGLVAIVLQLEAVSASLPADSPLHRRIDRAIALARVNLDEARRSVRDLRAAPLEHLSLLEALRQLVEQHRQETDAATELVAPEAMPLLDTTAETALFRFVQESLTNSRKHGENCRVWVEVDVGDSVYVTVRDNGPGFDVAAWRREAPLHRFGLHGMR
ncbi:MAG TPA: GAF domain-containing sensor histidine kinase, partial [Thermomicrobiales bacterium]|nr:GAF domain-containing sensor histidine kinase [Thermomicrobiales bacterium]